MGGVLQPVIVNEAGLDHSGVGMGYRGSAVMISIYFTSFSTEPAFDGRKVRLMLRVSLHSSYI